MEAINELDGAVEEEIVDVEVPDFDDDIDASMAYFSEYRMSDWKEVSDSFMQELASELEEHGLKLYIADTGGDEWAWRIDK